MADNPVNVEFDVKSLEKIDKIIEAPAVYGKHYKQAMQSSVEAVTESAKVNAPVLIGKLKSTIIGSVMGSFQGVVGSPSPYSRRREFGFDMQSDVLGRYYAMDPADEMKREKMMYVHHAINDNKPNIMRFYKEAITAGFTETAGL